LAAEAATPINFRLHAGAEGAVLKWSVEYATGVARIDEQHKMLFKMSQDFREALDEGQGERVYGRLLELLGAYAKAHFGFEEGCMERYRCPAAQQNSLAHGQFVEAISGFQKSYAVSSFNHAEAQRLVEFIDQWLADHICRIDVQLKACVKGS
jgi:hemerythrin